MNSEGEKMPPEAPEPRLTRGREKLGDEQPEQKPISGEIIGQDRLDGRVADALDEVVALEAEQRVDQHADHQHAERMAQIGILDLAGRCPRQTPARG